MINVMGLGYTGHPTALMMASLGVEAGIKFTTEYQKTDTYIVSVPTPYDKFSKKVDACYVVAAVKDVMKVCPKGAPS